MPYAVTFWIDVIDTEYLDDFIESTKREYASGDVVMIDSNHIFVETAPVRKWFVNEECEVYPYHEDTQEEHFPNDYHTGFNTEKDAQHFADYLMGAYG